MSLFKKDKVDESFQLTNQPETTEIMKSEAALPEIMREDFLNAIAEKVGIKVNAERSESHEYREEVIPPVITVGTDLDKEDEFTGEIKTKKDKWGFWLDYQGTKGKIFDTEVPHFQYGHLGAIIPRMRNKLYHYVYDEDEKTGEINKDSKGNPIIKKKERIHLGIEMSNLKARLNLAEDGYARNQQKDVIIGGVGQVDPYTGDRMKEALQFAFGKRK